MRGEAAVTSCGVCWVQGRKGGEYSGGREERLRVGYDGQGGAAGWEWVCSWWGRVSLGWAMGGVGRGWVDVVRGCDLCLDGGTSCVHCDF